MQFVRLCTGLHAQGRCCAVCGKPTTQRCGACAQHGSDLAFCSRVHQKLVWSTHRQVCGPKSSPFMPPALGDDEHDTVRSLRLNSGDVSFSGMLESLDEEQTARTCWDIMYGGGGATASTGEQRTANVVMAPVVEQAVSVQAYAQLQKAGSSSLTPFHHAAAMYVDMQRLCGGVSMPNFNDCLLHALLVVFTLVSLETRPERPPPAYNRDLVTAPLRKAFTIVTSCNLPSGGLFALQDLVVARLSPTVRLDITFYDAGPYIETVVKRV